MDSKGKKDEPSRTQKDMDTKGYKICFVGIHAKRRICLPWKERVDNIGNGILFKAKFAIGIILLTLGISFDNITFGITLIKLAYLLNQGFRFKKKIFLYLYKIK